MSFCSGRSKMYFSVKLINHTIWLIPKLKIIKICENLPNLHQIRKRLIKECTHLGLNQYSEPKRTGCAPPGLAQARRFPNSVATWAGEAAPRGRRRPPRGARRTRRSGGRLGKGSWRTTWTRTPEAQPQAETHRFPADGPREPPRFIFAADRAAAGKLPRSGPRQGQPASLPRGLHPTTGPRVRADRVS